MIDFTICRDFEKPPLATIISATDLLSIETILGGKKPEPSTWLVTDLSMGAWVSQQAAREISLQVGLSKPSDINPNMANMDKGDDGIGKLVDAEGQGKLSVVSALYAAQDIFRCIEGQSRLFLVIMPSFGFQWRSEDLAFLEFLLYGAKQFQSQVLFVALNQDYTPLPQHWQINDVASFTDNSSSGGSSSLLALMPGIVEQTFARKLNESDTIAQCISLGQDYLLVNPTLRQAPSLSRRLLYDRLAMLSNLPKAWQAYALYLGNNMYVDPAIMMEQAWDHFLNGSSEISIDLMQKTIECAQNLEYKARFLWELQGIRIALLRFDEAVAIDDPDEALPLEIRAGLLQTKGWGLTILGQAEQGTEYLYAAQQMLKPKLEGTRQFLFMQNIYALSRLKVGDFDGAMALEKSIESSLDSNWQDQGEKDWALIYVNSINQARLYTIAKQFDYSLNYYLKAFETTYGARTQSDKVYGNYCLAVVYEKQQNYKLALESWIRCCIHWLSSEAPESLAPRAANGILKRKASSLDTAAISEVFLTSLQRAVTQVNIQLPNFEDGPEPVFRQVNGLNIGQPTALVGDCGWSVIVGHSDGVCHYNDPAMKSLRRFLGALFKLLVPQFAWENIDTFWVDDRFGCEIPQSISQALCCADYHHLSQVVFTDQKVVLDQQSISNLHQSMVVKVGPAVSKVEKTSDGLRVKFKRYRPSVLLIDDEAEFIEQLFIKQQIAYSSIASSNDQALELIRRLEQGHLIELSGDLMDISRKQ